MAIITLNDGVSTVNLPGDLLWEDEYQWSPPRHGFDYSLNGAALVQVSTRQAGRPITLSGADDRGWIGKTALDQIYAFSIVPGLEMTLTLADARTFTVMFRHQEDNVVQAEPVMFGRNFYHVTLRLMQV